MGLLPELWKMADKQEWFMARSCIHSLVVSWDGLLSPSLAQLTWAGLPLEV